MIIIIIIINHTLLFISYFKEDMYTIKNLEASPENIRKFDIDSSISQIGLEDLYLITIDDDTICGLRWYLIEHTPTNQKGLRTRISLINMQDGYHELKIHKLYWNVRNNEVRLLQNWEIIPFELVKKADMKAELQIRAGLIQKSPST